jgi:hypothetical protein
MTLGGSFHGKALSGGLKNHFAHSHRSQICWFEAGFSKSAPPFAFPLILVAGLLLTTAIAGFGPFRD